ncbi:MAG: hypothetical protein CMH04_00120 [Marinovum sp.]|nr:hypothetical protein [Marinovum sp.]|tara:strand:+ start:546 stop:2690 length:2145 start_codon:yes stop_codon:yes gene_type:complete
MKSGFPINKYLVPAFGLTLLIIVIAMSFVISKKQNKVIESFSPPKNPLDFGKAEYEAAVLKATGRPPPNSTPTTAVSTAEYNSGHRFPAARVTIGTSTKDYYKCNPPKNFIRPNWDANPCKFGPIIPNKWPTCVSTSPDSTCSYLATSGGGGCLEKLTEEKAGKEYTCWLNGDMLADISNNVKYENDGVYFYGRKATSPNTAGRGTYVFNNTKPVLLKYGVEASKDCNNLMNGGCCLYPTGGINMKNSGEPSDSTSSVSVTPGESLLAKAVHKYFFPPSDCDPCSLRPGEADCKKSAMCDWVEGRCVKNAPCPAGCERPKMAFSIPSGTLTYKECSGNHICTVSKGKCVDDAAGEDLGPYAVVDSELGRVEAGPLCWNQYKYGQGQTCKDGTTGIVDAASGWYCHNGKAQCLPGLHSSPGNDISCVSFPKTAVAPNGCFLNESCELKTCPSGSFSNMNRDRCVNDSNATYGEKIKYGGYGTQMCSWYNGSDRNGGYCMPPLHLDDPMSTEQNQQCPTHENWLFYTKTPWACCNQANDYPCTNTLCGYAVNFSGAASQNVFCNTFATTGDDSYVCPSWSDAQLKNFQGIAANIEVEGVNGLEYSNYIIGIMNACRGKKPTYDQRVALSKFAVMTSFGYPQSKHFQQKLIAPHDIDPTNTHYGLRYPYTFPCSSDQCKPSSFPQSSYVESGTQDGLNILYEIFDRSLESAFLIPGA